MQSAESTEAFVPHRGNMLLVNQLLLWDTESASISVAPANSFLFFNEDGQVPAWVGLEYMAQSVAAYAGKLGSLKGEAVKLGFLLGTRKFISKVPFFKADLPLRVDIKKLLHDDNNLVLFACQLFQETELLATAEIKAIQPEDPQTLLNHFNS